MFLELKQTARIAFGTNLVKLIPSALPNEKKHPDNST